MLLNVALHTWVGGWTPYRPDNQEPRLGRYGLLAGAKDNLAYCSFAEQAKHGVFPCWNLNTTEPHRPLMASPLFYAVGRTAALFSCSPVLVFNGLALIAIPAFIAALFGIGRELKLKRKGMLAFLCLALGGGGLSWLPYVLHDTGLGQMLRLSDVTGPDLYNIDLYPAVVFSAFPYHAVALTLLAGLVYAVVRYEDPARRFSVLQVTGVFGGGLLLAATRPYEPLMLLAVYFLWTAASHLLAAPATHRARRRRLLLALAAGIVPWSVYSLWVAHQPGWRDFAESASRFGVGANWAAAFLLCGLLAVIACWENRSQLVGSPLGLFALWALAGTVLIVGLQSGLLKLCGGGTIPMALLAGVGLQTILAPLRNRVWVGAVMLAVALLALASPVVIHQQMLRWPVRLPIDLFPAAAGIRADAAASVPTVLADWDAGAHLPGLAACRVYCGHPGLTHRYEDKCHLLRALGFSRGSVVPRTAGERKALEGVRQELLEQVRGGRFEYLMVRKDHVLYESLQAVAALEIVYNGPMYEVVRLSPPVRQLLQDRLVSLVPVGPDRAAPVP